MYTLENAISDIAEASTLGHCVITAEHQLYTINLYTKQRFLKEERAWYNEHGLCNDMDIILRLHEYENINAKFMLFIGGVPSFWLETSEDLFKLVTKYGEV